jgi:hypothetical protein
MKRRPTKINVGALSFSVNLIPVDSAESAAPPEIEERVAEHDKLPPVDPLVLAALVREVEARFVPRFDPERYFDRNGNLRPRTTWAESSKQVPTKKSPTERR